MRKLCGLVGDKVEMAGICFTGMVYYFPITLLITCVIIGAICFMAGRTSAL